MSRQWSAKRILRPALALALLGLGSCGRPPAGLGGDGERLSREAGQRFEMRVIDDSNLGIPLVALLVPAGWEIESEVRWRYEEVSKPFRAGARIWNPEAPEEFTSFPTAACFWLEGAAAQNRAGQRALGLINLHPMPPAQALVAAIGELYRPGRTDLRVVGARDVPGLAAALGVDPSTVTGVGVKVEYEEGGIPLEEEFYALHYLQEVPYHGPLGRSVQINWGLDRVHGFRAPRGTLAERRDLFSRIAPSVRVNPAWQQRAEAIQAYLNEFDRQIAQGYANIEAAARLSRQISAHNDAMLAAIDRQLAAASGPSSGSSERSAADRFSDYVRGVDTFDDPYWGTTQRSYDDEYHWTDGYGSYRSSNDAGFDPNIDSSVTWQPLHPVP